MIDGLERTLAARAGSGETARAQAISLLAQAVVILSLARLDASALADEILDRCRNDCLTAIAPVAPPP